MKEPDDRPVTRLTQPGEALEAMVGFIGQACRSVDIFSHQLTPVLYEDRELVAGISALARRHRRTQVRILVRDTRPLVGKERALVALTRRLPSHITLRAYSVDGPADPDMGFFCVDQKDLVYFANESTYHGFFRPDARAESKGVLEEFNDLWRYHSRVDPNLRVLNL